MEQAALEGMCEGDGELQRGVGIDLCNGPTAPRARGMSVGWGWEATEATEPGQWLMSACRFSLVVPTGTGAQQGLALGGPRSAPSRKARVRIPQRGLTRLGGWGREGV